MARCFLLLPVCAVSSLWLGLATSSFLATVLLISDSEARPLVVCCTPRFLIVFSGFVVLLCCFDHSLALLTGGRLHQRSGIWFLVAVLGSSALPSSLSPQARCKVLLSCYRPLAAFVRRRGDDTSFVDADIVDSPSGHWFVSLGLPSCLHFSKRDIRNPRITGHDVLGFENRLAVRQKVGFD